MLKKWVLLIKHYDVLMQKLLKSYFKILYVNYLLMTYTIFIGILILIYSINGIHSTIFYIPENFITVSQ